MSIEIEVSERVYRNMKLHNEFRNGLFEEINALCSEDFQGWLYNPTSRTMSTFNAEQLREGNKQAAEFYKGKDISFVFTGLRIVPQSETEAAVSYEVIHRNENQIVRGLAMEKWSKESDGVWRLTRWYEEKSPKSS